MEDQPQTKLNDGKECAKAYLAWFLSEKCDNNGVIIEKPITQKMFDDYYMEFEGFLKTRSLKKSWGKQPI